MSCKILSNTFPAFTVDNKELVFMREFKYLGTMITDTLRDNCDIEREIRCLFVRCNILIGRFEFCSWHVKLRLFRTYYTCFYNIGLWRAYNVRTLHKFNSCYNKCLKRFFGFSKYSSLAAALLQTGLASSSTVLHNFTWRFNDMLMACDNAVVSAVSSLCLYCNDLCSIFVFVCVCFCLTFFLSVCLCVGLCSLVVAFFRYSLCCCFCYGLCLK